MTLFKQKLSIFLFLLALCSGNLQAQNWAPEHQFSQTIGALTRVASDNNGNAVAVWVEGGTLGTIQGSYFTQGAWGPAVVIGTPPLAESFSIPVVAMDASGNALIAWAQYSDGGVWVASFSGGVWSAPILISADEVSGNISISMDGTGKGIVAWGNVAGDINVSMYDGTTWGPVPTLAVLAKDPSVAISPTGTALITWSTLNLPLEILSRFYNGTIWEVETTISTGTLNGFSDVGIAANGRGIAVWADGINVYATLFNGTTWSAPTILSTLTGNGFGKVDVQANGRAVAAWLDNDGTIQASLFNGSSWTASTPVSTVPPVTDFEVAMDGNDNAIIVWTYNIDPIFQVWSALHVAGNGNLWQPPSLVTTSTQSVIGADAAFSSAGIAFAVWSGEDDGNAFGSFALIAPNLAVGFTGSSCTNRFAWQRECVNILTWQPTLDINITYRLRRNGTVIANIPSTGPYSYIDRNRCNQTDLYSLTLVNAVGEEGPPVFVLLRGAN